MRFVDSLPAVCTALALTSIVACGGTSPASQPPVTAETAAPKEAVVVKRAAPVASVHDARSADPDESPIAVRMKPLFTRQKPPHFPKPTVSDRECWRDIELTGEARKDYDALIARCGTPTGVVEYASPAKGHLHRDRDQRDSFKLELARGYCYRYFAVADSTIDDIDILVERYGGDLVGDASTRGQVAIIHADKPWCMDDDADYDFKVAVNGSGPGNYFIGAWARPKPR